MPQPAPATTQGTLRMLRIVHGAMIVAIVGYCVVLSQISPSSRQGVDRIFLGSIAFICVGEVAVGFVLRSRLITQSYETLRVTPDDPTALGRWRQGAIISAVIGESIVLFGFPIYVIGGRIDQSAPFFAAGTIVMLLWWPKQP